MALGSAAGVKQHILITPCHTASDQPTMHNHSESQEWWCQETNHLSERLKGAAIIWYPRGKLKPVGCSKEALANAAPTA